MADIRTSQVHRTWPEKLLLWRHAYQTTIFDGRRAAFGRGPTPEAAQKDAERRLVEPESSHTEVTQRRTLRSPEEARLGSLARMEHLSEAEGEPLKRSLTVAIRPQHEEIHRSPLHSAPCSDQAEVGDCFSCSANQSDLADTASSLLRSLSHRGGVSGLGAGLHRRNSHRHP